MLPSKLETFEVAENLPVALDDSGLNRACNLVSSPVVAPVSLVQANLLYIFTA